MLGHVPSSATTIVADLEAGIGTLTRLDDGAVDVALVVTEPTAKSIEVAQRAVEVAATKGVGRVIVVANRVSSEADVARIGDAVPGHELFAVADDPAIVRADRDGLAPLDQSPGSPAVLALSALADRLRD